MKSIKNQKDTAINPQLCMTQKMEFLDLSFNSWLKAYIKYLNQKIFMHNQLQVLYLLENFLSNVASKLLVDRYSVIVLLGLVS